MSDAEELADIRARKRAELERRLEDGEPGASEEGRAASATPTTPHHVESESQFGDFVDSHGVVLVDFHAEWCGPCKMLEPTVERLARETDAAVAKVAIDQHQGLASRYQVRGVPTLLLFSGGEPVERVVGVRDYGTLASLVDGYAA